MGRKAMWTAVMVALVAVLIPSAMAQKGKGDRTGVARAADRREVTTVSGELLRIKDGECSKTTGRSPTGIHLFLENQKDEEVNLHLGPTEAVSQMVEGLETGDSVTARAFTTDKMEENEHVAVRFRTENEQFILRDETLRPVWAGRPLAPPAEPENEDVDRSRRRRTLEPRRWDQRERYYRRSDRRRGRYGSYCRPRRGRGRGLRARRGRGRGRCGRSVSRGRRYQGNRCPRRW